MSRRKNGEQFVKKDPKPRARTMGKKQPKCTCFQCVYWGEQHTENRMELGEVAICYLDAPELEVDTKWDQGCNKGKVWSAVGTMQIGQI